MAVVVKWRDDGTYLQALVGNTGHGHAIWLSGQRRAMRFASQAEMREKVAVHMGWWPEAWTTEEIAVVRLVPRRRAEAASLSEPTARDAVSGMLLRYGYPKNARALLTGDESPEAIVLKLSSGQVSDGDRVCIAALEALARGNGPRIWVGSLPPEGSAEHVGMLRERVVALEGQLTEARRERDEARAAAAALREERAGEPAMRIERRADGEWLVGAPRFSGCEMSGPDGGACTQHFDGCHLATGPARLGAELICWRWPIASAQDARAADDAGGGP